jgi:hypothetical protein
MLNHLSHSCYMLRPSAPTWYDFTLLPWSWKHIVPTKLWYVRVFTKSHCSQPRRHKLYIHSSEKLKSYILENVFAVLCVISPLNWHSKIRALQEAKTMLFLFIIKFRLKKRKIMRLDFASGKARLQKCPTGFLVSVCRSVPSGRN